MDLGTIDGIWTALILVFFVGLVVWVMRRDRKEIYDNAAMLAVTDENPFATDRESTPVERDQARAN